MEAIEQSAKTAHDRLELWSLATVATGARAVCEVGVWKGAFAEHLLGHCPQIERYFMLDPWQNLRDWNKPFNVADDEFAHVLSEALARTDFAKHKRTICRGTTTQVARDVPDLALDLCYIDGDHTLRGILIDLVRMYPKVRNGGILGGDDLVPRAWQHGDAFEPTLVFPTVVHFAEATGSLLYALPFNQFALVVERSRDQFEFRDLTGEYSETAILKVMQRPDATLGEVQRPDEKSAAPQSLSPPHFARRMLSRLQIALGRNP